MNAPRPYRLAAVLAALFVPAALAAGSPPKTAPPKTAPPGSAANTAPPVERTIEVHVGIRDLAYLGQPLPDLLKKFPGAEVIPFAGQDDAASVKIASEGITCIAVGPKGDLRVASIGFNMSGEVEGIAETKYRTSKGIGKGSTVNDLLEAYGQPADILGAQPRGALRRSPPPDSPSLAKQYQYARDDGAVKSFFVVQDTEVTRLVVNEIAPLDQYIVKARAKK